MTPRNIVPNKNASTNLRRMFASSLLLVALNFGVEPPSWSSTCSSAANALPVSMLSSMTRFYPLNALIRQQEERWERQRVASTTPEATMNTALLELHEEFEQLHEDVGHGRAEANAAREEQQKPPSELSAQKGSSFGTLKLCPPGGRSFFEAYELACPMKKRRRKRHALFGFGRAPPGTMRRKTEEEERRREDEEEEVERRWKEAEEQEEVLAPQQQRQQYRPANISEIMHICCSRGCEIADFFPHCGPFSMW